MKTIFSGLINFIIVVIVTLAIFATFLFLNTNENGIVTIGDGSIIPINDDSMKGTLNQSDIIVVYKQSIESIVENDVVTYLYEQDRKVELLTKRVYLINEEDNQINLVLKGDAESENDIVTINATNVVGKWNNNQKMVFVGFIYNFILSTTGFIIIVTIPLIMLLGYMVYKLINKNKNNKKNEDNMSDITQEEFIQTSNQVIPSVENNTQEELIQPSNQVIPSVENNTQEELIQPSNQVIPSVESNTQEELIQPSIGNHEIENTEDDIEVL